MFGLPPKWFLVLALLIPVVSCGDTVTAWSVGDSTSQDREDSTDIGPGDVDQDQATDAGPSDVATSDLDATNDWPTDPASDPPSDLQEADQPISDSDDEVFDAPDDSEESITCYVAGVRGECLPTAECTGNRVSTPGYCPGPADIQCCTEISGAECDPSAVPQPNAGLTEAPGSGGCLAGMTRVDDFCVDRFEAALEEVLTDGSRIPWSPYFNPGERRIRAVSIRGAVPQGYITGRQAESACLEAEKRLCTDDEWLRACRGEAVNDYPYGADEVLGACNENRPNHPAVEYFGTAADWIWSQLGHPCINQLANSLALTGDYSQCVSAEGVFDLVGNLHEWTANPTGVFRGGFYVDTWRNGIACNYATTAHNREHWDYSTGFRCCADLD